MDMEHKPAPHPSDDALAKAFADAYRGRPDGAHLAGLRAVADLVAQELEKGQEPVGVAQEAGSVHHSCAYFDKSAVPPGTSLFAQPIVTATAPADAEIASLRAKLSEAMAERDELQDECDELKQQPWPEWAEKCLKIIRKYSGYDGFDDGNGVDLVEELTELLEGAAPADAVAMDAEQTKAAADVLAERKRQVEDEGWPPEDDDRYIKRELSAAAECYVGAASARDECPAIWPWAREWWKPSDYRRNLVKAGALILAEIERLDRAAAVCRHPNALPNAIGPTLDEYVCPDCGKSWTEGD